MSRNQERVNIINSIYNRGGGGSTAAGSTAEANQPKRDKKNVSQQALAIS